MAESVNGDGDRVMDLDINDPYVDWWRRAEGQRLETNGSIESQGISRKIFLRSRSDAKDRNFVLPLPKDAKNPNFCAADWNNWQANSSDYPNVEPNDIIVGIIDTSFALGHRRFRFENGESRVLAAWLQGAESKSTEKHCANRHLPFGHELSTREIECELAKHSSDGKLTGVLDQEGFNRAIGLVDADKPSWEGSKELQSFVSHGTHMMDVAGGINPGDPGAMLCDTGPRCHFIVVSLPPLFFHGHSGNFLQYHAVLGLIRIMRIADEISRVNKYGDDHQFPVVVNFSFGFEAGPKDGSLSMERSIRYQIRKRACDHDEEEQAAFDAAENSPDESAENSADSADCQETDTSSSAKGAQSNKHQKCKRRDVKTFVNMPAGNSNLLRIAAHTTVTPTKSEPLELVLQPNDHSSTYMEYWSEPFNKSTDYFSKAKLKIKPPIGAPITVRLGNKNTELREKAQNIILETGECVGRVYPSLMRSPLKGKDQVRLRIVIALAPTLLFFRMGEVMESRTARRVGLAPAGRWSLELKRLTYPLRLDAYVQADLFGGPLSQNARRAYFDHPDYRDYLESGHVRDSFTSDYPHQPLDNGPVSRVGTHNALASSPYTAMIGGYRCSDGTPVGYSATGYLGPPEHYSRSDVDVMFPCEDGAAHPGILGAGTRDGSVVALNGTSAATALASRSMVDKLLRHASTTVGQPWLQRRAELYKHTLVFPTHYKAAPPQKAGAGHLPYPAGYLNSTSIVR